MSSNPYEPAPAHEQRPENAGYPVPSQSGPLAPEAAYSTGNHTPTYYGAQSAPQQSGHGYGGPQYPSPYDGGQQGNDQHYQTLAGERHAKISLICGVIGILIFGLILGPIAIWQARKAEALGVHANPGKVTGWVAIGLSALVLILNLTVGLSGSFTVG